MSRRMLQHRYPKGKGAEANQPATTSLPTPATDAMPQQWDGAFQPAQYPVAAHLQQPQEGWSSLPTSAANGSTAGSAVHYGGPVSGESYWNSHQPLSCQPSEEAVTGGSAQPWSSEVSAVPSWPEGAMAPPPTGVGGAGETTANSALYLGQQQYTGVATSWEGSQWAPGPEQAYGQWQWQGGIPAEGWSPPVDAQWQGTQMVPVGHPSAAPSAEPLLCPLPGHLQDQDGCEASLENAVGSMSSAPPAVDSLGFVELQQEQHQPPQQHSEALGDDGTVSMFFQDGDSPTGVDERRESAGGLHPVPQVVEELSTSTGFVVDALLDGEDIKMSPTTHGAAPPPPGSDEPINQEVLPASLPEPREVLPSQEEGGAEEALSVPLGVECSAPAPSKKAVIRARQGGAFKPPVRQGSTTDTALMQQQNGGPPENLELLPPDGRPSLRRPGAAPLSTPGPIDPVGAGLTLLDAPDMQPLVTLAPAAPPIDSPSSRALAGEAPSIRHRQCEPSPRASEEATEDPGPDYQPAPRPLMRQSPLGREGGTARSNVPRVQAAPVLASSPLLSERTEPSGSTDHPQLVITATRAGEDMESLPVVRPNATSTPTSHPSPHHDPTSVGNTPVHAKHEGPGDKGESRTRQEETGKGKKDVRDYRDERDFRDSRDNKPARDYRETRSARARGSDDEAVDWKGSRDDFDRDGRRAAKGDFREDQERKRDRHYDRPDDRRATAKGDPEEYRKGAGRSGVTEDRKRRDDYHDDRRGDWKDDYYEDRRGDRREEFRDDYRKGERRGERHSGRREQLRVQESDEEWRERRSDRRGDRDGGGRHDWRHDDRYSDRARPSSRVSQDGRGERRRPDCRPASRHSESDSSSPDSRKGYTPGRQKRPGSAGGHNYSAYQRDYYNYYHRYGIAPGAVYGVPPGSGFGYGYHDELYRTNPAYKQQVDAYYGRLGGHPAHLTERHSVHSGRSSVRDESFASNTEDDCDPSILDTESTRLDHVPEPEEVRKFSRPHPLARFCGANGLLKLVPSVNSGSLPPPIELHSLKHLFQKDPQFHQLQAFPGPLVRSDTHKNDVIQFCTQKIESFSTEPSLADRSSHILLWELLVLMLRQNGFVSGSDIAELLLRGTLEPVGQPGGVTSPEGADDGSSPSPDEGIVVSDRTQLGATGSSRTLAKFREFLLFGHKKDALEWAVKCGLWGHALFLAAKMDTRTYAGIMTCLTNALAINDPLQTLYQHLSGRQPAAVTCIADTKWGDWRPHLAMILSNPSSRPEVDARSITTLGDVLASRGCLPAAHFCYLMSQVEFGSYSCKASKLVLLGSNHQTLPFAEFASNEAIQCTEIYEYSQSLASPEYMLPHLQVYKFLHAARLAEYGFAHKALHYCEVLSDAMVRQCGPAQLAAQTYELADRLKYYDPHFSQGQGEFEELGDPAWLQTFAQLLALLQQQQQEGGVTSPQYGQERHEAQPVAEVPSNESFQCQQSFASSTGFAAHDSTFLQENSSYLDSPGCRDGAQAVAPEQWNSMAHGSHEGFSPMSSTPFMPSSPEAGWNSQQVTPPTTAQPSIECSFPSSAVESATMVNGVPPQAPSPSPVSGGQTSSFDYYKASTYSAHRKTSRERVSSVSSSTDTRRDSVDSAGLTSSGSTERRAKPPVAGKSWLGGIFGKLLPKGPNQMILPDDKDPDIVWDEQKKCWVDKNAAPGEMENPMAAPPSDSSLLAAAKPSPISNKLGENRFQLNKQRSLRKHYVDVLNPGGNKASGDAPPTAAPFPEQAPPQFFVPPTVRREQHDTTPSYDFVSSVPPPEQTTAPAPLPPKSSAAHQQPGKPVTAPLMYDPAEFTARPVDGGSHKTVPGNLARRRAYPT